MESNSSNTTNDAPQSLSRRQKMARGIVSKIDNAYTSIHALEIITSLLQDTHTYITTISRDLAAVGVELKTLDVPLECLRISIDGLDEHGSILSQAIVVNSKRPDTSAASTSFKTAQDKLMKSQKLMLKNNSEVLMMSMMRSGGRGGRGGTKDALSTSLHHVKGMLEDILSRTDPDFIDPGRVRKKKREREMIVNNEGGSLDDNDNDTQADAEVGGGGYEEIKVIRGRGKRKRVATATYQCY